MMPATLMQSSHTHPASQPACRHPTSTVGTSAALTSAGTGWMGGAGGESRMRGSVGTSTGGSATAGEGANATTGGGGGGEPAMRMMGGLGSGGQGGRRAQGV